MRYSLNLPNGGACADARTLAELAHDAEEAGWDGVFLEDYILYQGVSGTPTFDPWVALAAMALRTNRILLGTDVTPLPRRRPWKLARETVTLDHLSNGRLVLGVGLGDSPETSFTHFGEVTDTRQRARMLDEALERAGRVMEWGTLSVSWRVLPRGGSGVLTSTSPDPQDSHLGGRWLSAQRTDAAGGTLGWNVSLSNQQ